jgi:phospholipid/cholesterol/gamma-HCH transport system substrate-binding protein
MHHSRKLETAVGLFVALAGAALFLLAMQVSNLSSYATTDGYSISARFSNIGQLKVRAPVSMGGVLIGRVEAIDFDMASFEAVVRMRIQARFDKLPTDTSASIFTSGLLGEQYVGLEPGGEEEYLADGDELEITQSALVLEQLIGQFLFSQGTKGSSE